MPPKTKAKRQPAKAKKPAGRKKGPQREADYVLPTGRRTPVVDPWAYAFLITGEKKIGKTSFAIEGAEELVIQCDKPQLSYDIREEALAETSKGAGWAQFKKIIKALKTAAADGTLPYNRVIVDGAGEWYEMCESWCCKKLLVDHLSDVEWGKGWSLRTKEFTQAVNDLLSLQTAGCGIIFIAHSVWQEQQVRGGSSRDKKMVLKPLLPSKCEEIINGKVDGWFVYDYSGTDRVLVTCGDETNNAGHRIDGRFKTTDGRPVSEIHMGSSPKEALKNFIDGFNNKLEYANYKEWKVKRKKPTKKGTKR